MKIEQDDERHNDANDRDAELTHGRHERVIQRSKRSQRRASSVRMRAEEVILVVRSELEVIAKQDDLRGTEVCGQPDRLIA